MKVDNKSGFVVYTKFLLRSAFSRESIKDFFQIRRKPTTLQMPITSRCNSRCVTCNVWKNKEINDIDPIKLRECLNDDFFTEVLSVGINGGEISMVPNFLDILSSVLSLKKIQSVFLISNGLLPNKLLPLLQESKKMCDKKGVSLNVALSVDGYGNVHEQIRGVPKCFTRTKAILDAFKEAPSLYAHGISIGCTLSKNNIAYVRQTEEFLRQYPFPVQYHLAVPNKRIGTFDDYEDYYLINDDHALQLATEYFYEKFMMTRWSTRYAYFAQYYFLKNKGKKRITRCDYRYRDVTIDENLNIYLCATASECIGNLKDKNAKTLMRSNIVKEIEKKTFKHCNDCVHYMYDRPTIKGVYLFIKEIVKTRIDWDYKFKKD